MEMQALDRSQVAGIQKYLLLEAEQGDDSAMALYREAADELGLMVLTAARKIQIPGERLSVSVSGGLMHAEKFFLDRFLEWVGRFDGQYIKPLMTPVKGAALMAVEKFRKKSIV
ncbi:MAG TPA: hypothetical protein H9765_12425 [Candidatus Mediterraneibacter intestinigallinarum]|nr:hypothetical protein [Candidatus Mediterraneibacter intestinigallinarum]